MGSLKLTGVSGEGHHPLDAMFLVAVTGIDTHVTTYTPKQRLVGTGAIPEAIWGAGEVGLGWFSDDPSGASPPAMIEDHFIHLMYHSFGIKNFQGGTLFFGSVWWRLAPGVVINLEVGW